MALRRRRFGVYCLRNAFCITIFGVTAAENACELAMCRRPYVKCPALDTWASKRYDLAIFASVFIITYVLTVILRAHDKLSVILARRDKMLCVVSLHIGLLKLTLVLSVVRQSYLAAFPHTAKIQRFLRVQPEPINELSGGQLQAVPL